MKSTSRVTLNQWHVVTANRSARVGSFQLDSGNVLTMFSPSRAVGLDVQSNFYLGGVPQLSSVSPRAVENSNVLKDFTGCIDKLQVLSHRLETITRIYCRCTKMHIMPFVDCH